MQAGDDLWISGLARSPVPEGAQYYQSAIMAFGCRLCCDTSSERPSRQGITVPGILLLHVHGL